MTNCRVTVYQDTDTLSAGQRVAGAEVPAELYSGPAYLSAPSRSWQQAAAFEGHISGVLHIHSAKALRSALRVEVLEHPDAGTYYVADAALSGRAQWRLTLERRP